MQHCLSSAAPQLGGGSRTLGYLSVVIEWDGLRGSAANLVSVRAYQSGWVELLRERLTLKWIGQERENLVTDW